MPDLSSAKDVDYVASARVFFPFHPSDTVATAIEFDFAE